GTRDDTRCLVPLTPATPHTVAVDGDLRSALLQLGERGREMAGRGAGERDISARDGPRDEQGACLDAVRDDAVACAADLRSALDLDALRAGAVDPGPHRRQKARQVCDLGLS